jgi:hypothetical protein
MAIGEFERVKKNGRENGTQETKTREMDERERGPA